MRKLRWVKVGEDWAIRSSEPLVRGSTVEVENARGESSVVTVGQVVEDEDDYTYEIVR